MKKPTPGPAQGPAAIRPCPKDQQTEELGLFKRRQAAAQCARKAKALAQAGLHLARIPDSHKYCNGCKSVKALTGFSLEAGAPQGRRARCIPCRTTVGNAWSALNPLRLQAYRNPPERRARAAQRGREWALKHPERRKLASRKSTQKFREGSPEKVLAYTNSRRIAGQKPGWVSWPEIWAVYRKAIRLTRETGVKHHVDHCYPVSAKHGVCGLNCPANFRVIPAALNHRKSDKLPGFWAHELWDPDNANVHYD